MIRPALDRLLPGVLDDAIAEIDRTLDRELAKPAPTELADEVADRYHCGE